VTLGSLELPMPLGEPGSLWRAAALYASVGSHAGQGVIATQGGHTFFLNRTWAGVAFEAAQHDCAVLAGRITRLSERMPSAAAALGRYASALDVARRRVLQLQRSWDEAQQVYRTAIHDLPFTVGPGSPDARTFAHQAAAARATACTQVRAEYVSCLRLLDEAGDLAATALQSLAGEVLPSALAAPGIPRSGSGTDAAVRGVILDGLGLVVGRLAWVQAESDAAGAANLLDRVAAGDVGAADHVDQVASLLRDRVGDPVFARALMARWTPDQLTDVVAALALPGAEADHVQWRNSGPRSHEVVAALGIALTTAANPDRARGLDPVTDRLLTRWRGAWLGALAASVGRLPSHPAGSVGGGWAQGQLLAGAARTGPGHSPGGPYVQTVGVALVQAERAALGGDLAARAAATSRLDRGNGFPPNTVAPQLEDALGALQHTLRGDIAATRAFMLHPLPGEQDVLVIDHLVRDRFRLVLDGRAARSMDTLGQLVVEAGSDDRDVTSMHLAARYLDAVGSTATDTDDLAAFRRALSPSLYDLATVIGAHPDAVTDVLERASLRGTDVALLGSIDRFVQDGRTPGTYDIVLRDRRVTASLLGELALGQTDLSGPAGDPTRAPALVHVTQAVVSHQGADLVTAISRDHSGDTHALDAAAGRLGRTVGFVIASGGEALAGVHATQDADNAAMVSLAQSVLAKIPAPPVAGQVGGLLMPYVRLGAGNVIAQLLPTDGEATQRAETDAALTRAGDEAVLAGRTLVSQAAPWTKEQSPQSWAASTARVVTPFWGPDGHPRPETTMETAQLRSFNDWRRDMALTVYDTAPQAVRAAVADGARAAVTRAG
jgi:hypothetical protein